MRNDETGAKVYRFEVWHHEYGATVVDSAGPERAVMAACKSWGADWGREAAYCRATKLGTAARPRCRRCHREFGEPGDAKALCPECLELEERRRREIARYRPARRDRRAAEE